MMNISNISNNAILNERSYSNTQIRDSSFKDILQSYAEIQNESIENRIENLFGNMDVSVKVGECNVSKQMWESGYFPFWNYFDQSTEANALNDWSWKDNTVRTNTERQEKLQAIGFGEMVIMIPENVKRKMTEDEEYAESMIQKLAAWKKNYDLEDNAIAAMNGLNTSLYQMSKSYCITIDDNGEIGNFAVVGGGLDDTDKGIDNTSLSNNESKNYLERIQKNGYEDDKQINVSQLGEGVHISSINFDYTQFIDTIASAVIKRRD